MLNFTLEEQIKPNKEILDYVIKNRKTVVVFDELIQFFTLLLLRYIIIL